MPKELPEKVKKNLLDLHYNRYLQYYNTTIIILFTYIVGLGIAFITKQIDYKSLNQMLSVAIVTIAVVAVIVLLMLQFKEHMNNIIQEIKKLKI
ncbi:MAG: hypothetical protein KKC75_01450 [Nanoarchaeota archaeon]|nr:hypothetical protein [Nanoarchaeota archaeon]MBU1004382.1 hypothetical protein [Nanoarchaeota archaeon]MBU1946731.1 hypothetical protein [Nanoarchaeota archaeon]